ncbi:response regulator transcription factor [Jatrophihabitans telluris]|uniref:Response regulator transcription factor n=1 Tax=Jatrophihabitans telluris TaxID=2038343 RepID=A0ABY4QU70_9ACTN|nr:response regulator transcription factor [Jatrophihabitans telluris]UQX86848.1 response regulator transcription factor [Jatrophihabitans telluris]
MGSNASPERASTVLVVEDEPGVVAFLVRHLQSHPDLQVCATAATGREAVELSRTLQPDVVILDWHLADATGETVLPRLLAQSPGVRVVVYTSDPSASIKRETERLGHRLVLKGSDLATLVAAIRGDQRPD